MTEYFDPLGNRGWTVAFQSAAAEGDHLQGLLGRQKKGPENAREKNWNQNAKKPPKTLALFAQAKRSSQNQAQSWLWLTGQIQKRECLPQAATDKSGRKPLGWLNYGVTWEASSRR